MNQNTKLLNGENASVKVFYKMSAFMHNPQCIRSNRLTYAWFMFIIAPTKLIPQYQGYFYFRGLTLIPAWINDYIYYEVGIKLLIHFQTSTVQPLEFGNAYIILSNTLLSVWLLIHYASWSMLKKGDICMLYVLLTEQGLEVQKNRLLHISKPMPKIISTSKDDSFL